VEKVRILQTMIEVEVILDQRNAEIYLELADDLFEDFLRVDGPEGPTPARDRLVREVEAVLEEFGLFDGVTTGEPDSRFVGEQ